MNKKAFKEALHDSLKFLWKTTLVAIPLYFIHELGHITAQLLVGFPISIAIDPSIGISTTAGLGIAIQPPNIFYPVVLSGLIASILPINYLKKFLWFPKEFGNLNLMWYMFLCLGIASHDLTILILYTNL
jgi:hypothetical protein